TEEGSETLMEALEAGAVAIILTPKFGAADFLREQAERICDVVRSAAHARVGSASRRIAAAASSTTTKLTADAVLPPPVARPMSRTTEIVICVGASTGGTEALRVMLEVLPANSPGIVIVQHMPEKFTAAFAKRLDGLC